MKTEDIEVTKQGPKTPLSPPKRFFRVHFDEIIQAEDEVGALNEALENQIEDYETYEVEEVAGQFVPVEIRKDEGIY